MRDLDLDMKPTKVEDDGSKVFVLTLICRNSPSQILIHSQVKIQWPDGHDSMFNRQWLIDRSFTRATTEKRKVYQPRPNPKLWQGDHKVECYNYDDLMNDNEMLYKFLVSKL